MLNCLNTEIIEKLTDLSEKMTPAALSQPVLIIAQRTAFICALKVTLLRNRI